MASAASPAALPGVEVTGGLSWTGGARLGAADATLRTNDPSSTPYPVFASRTRLGHAMPVQAGVAWAMGRRFAVEARASMGHPTLETIVSADIEGAAGVVATDRLDAYRFDGGVAFHWPERRFAGFTPFVTGGAGYLRLRHDGRLLIEDAVTYHAGGGVRRRLWDAPRGVVTSWALIGEGRVHVMPDGISVAAGHVRTVSMSVLVAAGF
jgi:hypothetical protein